MDNVSILMHQVCEKPVQLTDSCMTENGLQVGERFLIVDIIGNFEQVVIENQYDQEFIINVNQIL